MKCLEMATNEEESDSLINPKKKERKMALLQVVATLCRERQIHGYASFTSNLRGA